MKQLDKIFRTCYTSDMANKTYTHKTTGWTRTAFADGSMRWSVQPPDWAAPARTVKFLSAGTWQKDPGDDPSRSDMDRFILLDGPALPDWAVTWLTFAVRKQTDRARENMRAMMDDADNAPFRNEGW